MSATLFRPEPALNPGQPPAAAPRSRLKVAYIASRFPKLTETFVLYEIGAVERQAVDVELYPLQRENTEVMHPEARPLVARSVASLFSAPATDGVSFDAGLHPVVQLGKHALLRRSSGFLSQGG